MNFIQKTCLPIFLLFPVSCLPAEKGTSEKEIFETYQSLENVFINSNEAKKQFRIMKTAVCRKLSEKKRAEINKNGESSDGILPINSFGGAMPYAPYCATKELTLIDSCSNHFLIGKPEEYSYWLYSLNKIGFVIWYTALAKKYGVPEATTQPILEKLRVHIRLHIRDLLARKGAWRSNEKPPNEYIGADPEFSGPLLPQVTIIQDEIDNFARAWNSYVLKLPKKERDKTPLLSTDEGCGAGEIDCPVRTKPANGVVRYISEWDWLLCKVRNVDPWDSKECRGWIDVVTASLPLIGTYKFVAKWPGRQPTKSTVQVSADMCKERKDGEFSGVTFPENTP